MALDVPFDRPGVHPAVCAALSLEHTREAILNAVARVHVREVGIARALRDILADQGVYISSFRTFEHASAPDLRTLRALRGVLSVSARVETASNVWPTVSRALTGVALVERRRHGSMGMISSEDVSGVLECIRSLSVHRGADGGIGAAGAASLAALMGTGVWMYVCV